MAQKAHKITEVTPALEYFFAVLEKENNRIEQLEADRPKFEEILIDEIEGFVRSLKTQNIFIHTVGLTGKHESTILAKAIFSLNKLIKIYYSTSFDEQDTGFIRVCGDEEEQQIVVERVHGYRAQPERLYASQDQCHIIRYLTQWILKRVDWEKTKLNSLDIYQAFVSKRQEEIEAEVYDEDHWMESSEVQ